MADNAELPCASALLSRRLEMIAARYLVERYSGPGNPMQAQILRAGTAVATKVPFVPRNALMNAVHCLEDPAELPRVLEFYAETKQPCWIGLAPHADTELSGALIEHGFHPCGYKAVLYASAAAAAAAAAATSARTGGAGVSVERVGAGELAPFLDTLNRGFDTPENMLPGVRRNQSFWSDVQHWRLYLARVGGEPAGAAVLAIADGLGYLAAGSTLPAMRKRGVHTALLARRLADAAAEGCELVTGQAEFASASHRNQQRAGLQLAHVRQEWTNA